MSSPSSPQLPRPVSRRDSRIVLLALCVVECAGALGLLSCSNTPPRVRTIPEERFVDLYAHVLVVQEEGRLRGTDSLALKARTDSLSRAYGVTRDQVQTELGYYRADLPAWRELYDKVIQRLEQLQREERTSQH